MLGFHFRNHDISNLQLLMYITLLQIWWIAVWGIAYIIIEQLSNKSQFKELMIYIVLLTGTLIFILTNPKLMSHL